MRTPRPPVLALFLFVTVALGCKEESQMPVYQVVPVTRRDISVTVNATGSIQPVDSVDIKSKASGEITKVLVQTGDAVKRGQLLLQVDPRTPRAVLEQARADLVVAQAQKTNAESQLRRAEELWKTKSITDTEYDNAKFQAAQANAAVVRAETGLENARISFEDTDVRAPKDGVILTKSVDIGSVIQSATGGVSGGAVLMKMANLDSVQVRALVDETDIGKLQAGMEVSITVDAYPNRPFVGQVFKIEPQSVVQQQVTMFPVLVRLPNPNHLLRPGMNAEIAITVGDRRDVIAVPNSALRTQRDVASAAGVLGLTMEDVNRHLANANGAASDSNARAGGAPDSTGASNEGEMLTTPDGRQVPVPAGVDGKKARELLGKMAAARSGGGMPQFSDDDRQVMQQLRTAGVLGGGGPGGGGRMMTFSGPGDGDPAAMGSNRRIQRNLARSAQRQALAGLAFGGNYIVFVNRGGQPTAVPVQTGLTDLDYSEVITGLTESDSILVLPSASLIAAQEQFEQMRQRMSSPIPGARVGGGGGNAVRR